MIYNAPMRAKELGLVAGVALGLAACSGTRARICGATYGHVLAATIDETASTNQASTEVTVYCDGAAERTVGTSPPMGALTVAPKTWDAEAPEVLAFIVDLDAVWDVSAVPTVACPKSVSFGTTITVTAAGKTSGDLECLDHPSAAASALLADGYQLLSK